MMPAVPECICCCFLVPYHPHARWHCPSCCASCLQAWTRRSPGHRCCWRAQAHHSHCCSIDQARLRPSKDLHQYHECLGRRKAAYAASFARVYSDLGIQAAKLLTAQPCTAALGSCKTFLYTGSLRFNSMQPTKQRADRVASGVVSGGCVMRMSSPKRSF